MTQESLNTKTINIKINFIKNAELKEKVLQKWEEFALLYKLLILHCKGGQNRKLYFVKWLFYEM